LEKNKHALYIKTKGNHVTANSITENKIGVYLLGGADKNLFVKNFISGNYQRNIRSKTSTGLRNFFDQIPKI